MLRIVIDCRMIGSGGIGSFVSELIPHFLEENECLLLGTHDQCMPFLRMNNVEFCYCDVKPFSLKEIFNFPQEILNKINSYDFYFSPYCNIPNGLKIPVFSTIHDIVFLDVQGLTGFAGKIARKYIYQRAINLSKAVFTVSEFSKERILAKLRCKKPLTVVYNSAPSYLKNDSETDDTTKNSVSSTQAGSSENTKNSSSSEQSSNNSILFVGNIKKHKGLKILLDGWEKARSKGSDLKLIITGNKDNFRTGDEETIERLNKLDQSLISFTGKISNEQLKKLYKNSRVLVQPSLYEGFGMPPLEAMTMGTPAIISDIPVFREIYRDFPVTYFESENSDDLCQKLLDSKLERISLGELNEYYSYKKSAEIIVSQIAGFKKHL